MADAAAMAEHRNTAMLKDVIHKFSGSARDNQINIAVHFKNPRYVSTIFQRANCVAQSWVRRCQGLMPDGNQNTVRLVSLSASFEYQSVAGLDGERSDLRNHVWTRFKNHGYYTQRAGNFMQYQAVIQLSGG